ncbi:MAG: hypothetical protein BGO65_15130 [Afipia sp. 64-13]|nr:MAG: hypothetical protein BGO65_15130 [Afipia sp. 64-13]
MYIERTFILDVPIQRAWAFLHEPHEIGSCLPGCHSVEVVKPGKYTASVGVKFGPVKLGFDVQVETDEERPPEYAAYTMRGADKDGSSKVSAQCTIALRALESRRTEVTYTSSAQIVGKLGKFAGGMMQKFADNINDQFIAAIAKRVSEIENNAPISTEVEKRTGRFGRLRAVLGKWWGHFRWQT